MYSVSLEFTVKTAFYLNSIMSNLVLEPLDPNIHSVKITGQYVSWHFKYTLKNTWFEVFGILYNHYDTREAFISYNVQFLSLSKCLYQPIGITADMCAWLHVHV